MDERLLMWAFASALMLHAAVAATAGVAKPMVSVQAPGADLTSALKQAFGKRLAASGLSSTFSSWDGQLSALQKREAAGGAEPDALLAPNSTVLAACREGLLLPLDRDLLGPHQDSPDASACGLPGFSAALVLAWDKTRDQTPPSWSDFWDVARYPGKRGLQRQARGTLEIALMADGVATGDVYGVLASSGGIDRAFRKLDQLRPYVVWWTDGDAARRALASGGVMMTVAPASYGAAGKGGAPSAIGVQWTQALNETLSWAVPRGAPDPSAAWEMLRLQQQPDWQAAVTAVVPVVGVAAGVSNVIADDLLARTAAAPHRAEQMLQINAAFWRDHPELEGRFSAWLARCR